MNSSFKFNRWILFRLVNHVL